jgi:hypothetical protein
VEVAGQGRVLEMALAAMVKEIPGGGDHGLEEEATAM